jgi:hypothetical protein
MVMKPKVYIETTIISYLAARPTNDPMLAGDFAATRQWWDEYRPLFEIFTSTLVNEEAAQGDAEAAAARLKILALLDELPVSDVAKMLANSLVSRNALPSKARVDALHVAIAATNGLDYLLTWNCRHLANATLRTRIESVCREQGYEPPLICTPPELTEVQS